MFPQLLYSFSIWDQILTYILEPLKSFLKLIFNTVFGTIINSILVPVLEQFVRYIIRPILEIVWGIIQPLIWSVLYLLFEALLGLLDVLDQGFNIFSGMADVSVRVAGVREPLKMSLLDAILNHTGLGTIMYMVTALGVIFAIVATIYSVIRSTLDLEGKLPLSHVLGSAIKSGLTFLVIPLFMKFALDLSATLLKALDKLILSTMGAQATNTIHLSDLIYYLTAKNATNKLVELIIGNKGVEDIMLGLLNGSHRHADLDGLWASIQQSTVVDVTDMLLIQGIFLTLFCAIVLCMAIFIFISRIFEVMLLYIVSPFFAASIPLDDGKSFQRWMNMFVAKVLSGYGIVLMMKLYLMIIPYVVDGRTIVFSQDELTNSIFSMVFLAGGAYAVYQSSSLLTSIINIEATGMEQSSQMLGASVAGGMLNATKASGKTIWNGLDFTAVGGGKTRGLKDGVQSGWAYLGSRGGTTNVSDYRHGNYKGGRGYSGKAGNTYAGTKNLFVPTERKTKKQKREAMAMVSRMHGAGASQKDIEKFLRDNGYKDVDVSGKTETEVDNMLRTMGFDPLKDNDSFLRLNDKGYINVTDRDEVYQTATSRLVDNAEHSTAIHAALRHAKATGELEGTVDDAVAYQFRRAEDASAAQKKPNPLAALETWNRQYEDYGDRLLSGSQDINIDAGKTLEALDYWKEQGETISSRPVSSWMTAYNRVKDFGESNEEALYHATYPSARPEEASTPQPGAGEAPTPPPAVNPPSQPGAGEAPTPPPTVDTVSQSGAGVTPTPPPTVNPTPRVGDPGSSPAAATSTDDTQ